jgi:uroporphyrinogen decarboxylase
MDKIFLKACRGEATDYTPIWLNRQAGRYMPEYHALKGETSSLAFFKDPDKAAQATLDAQAILKVDAAIMFADLLPIMEPMGLDLDYVPGVGPVFANPVRSKKDVDALRNAPATEATPYIAQTVTNILSGLPKEIALIGFAGAPFTLASYSVEGKGSRNYVFVKKMMYEAPELWHELMRKLTDQLGSYLELQIEAGVDAVQLFDSWVGCLSVADFRTYVFEHTLRLVDRLRGRVPVIYFGTSNHHLLPEIARLKADVVAIDWRSPLAESWTLLGTQAIQGNLDPIVLCADQPTIARQAGDVLDHAGGRPGHIFNLGHGIIPETPVDNVKYLVDFVHQHSSRG